MKKQKIKSVMADFRSFARDRENRRTIVLILAVTALIVFADLAKNEFSGVRYVVYPNGNVESIVRENGDDRASFELRVEASRGDEKEKKDVSITLDGAEEKERSGGTTAEQESPLELKISETVDALSSKGGKRITLPASLDDGTKLIWRKAVSFEWLALLLIAPLLIWAIFLNGENRKREARRRKREEVEERLPAFTDHLLLLTGSGLIFRDAFSKIADGYRESGAEGFDRVIVGIDDAAGSGTRDIVSVLDEKARELNVREFSRITELIKDNQLKGVDLSGKLAEESRILWALRKKKAEEKGKLAETKLSAPLALLLLVLMMITAAPAILQVKGG